MRYNNLSVFILSILLFSVIKAQELKKFDLNPGIGSTIPLFFSNRVTLEANIGITVVSQNDELGLVQSDGTAEGTDFLVKPQGNIQHISLSIGITPEYFHTNFFQVHTEVGFLFALITDSGAELDRLGPDDTQLPVNPVSLQGTSFGQNMFSTQSEFYYFFKNQDRSPWENNIITFFAYAPDSVNMELWKSDGTEEGTVMVKDIYKGNQASWPADFTLVLEDPSIPWDQQPDSLPAALFFTAYDSAHGKELWVTDGKEENTYMVKDINEGINHSYAHLLTAMGNKLYFVAATFEENNELWVSDGTEEGTHIVKIILPGASYLYIDGLINLDNRLWFTASDGAAEHGQELWTSDGTEEGTYMVKDIDKSGWGSNPQGFTMYNKKVYFNAQDSASGRELWVSDGSEEGTFLVKDINPGPDNSNPRSLEVFEGYLYFVANDSIVGNELWRTDGTEEGTELVFDIKSGAESSFIWPDLHAVGNNLFFYADDGVIGEELMALSNTSTAIKKAGNSLAPKQFALHQNYPNPFNPTTTINYSLPLAGHVRLIVYNSAGQKISSLVDKLQNKGEFSVSFDAKDLSSGIYFYRIEAKNYVSVKKMLLLK